MEIQSFLELPQDQSAALTSLEINFSQINKLNRHDLSVQLEDIIDALSQCTNLLKLSLMNLHADAFNNKSFNQFIEFLTKHQHLKHLDFTGTNFRTFTDLRFAVLSVALIKLKLISLDLSHTRIFKISKNKKANFINILQQSDTLEDLSLAFNDSSTINQADWQNLMNALEGKEFISLNLSSLCNLHDNSHKIKPLIQLLATLRKLKVLDLTYSPIHEISAHTWPLLVEALTKTHLQNIIFSRIRPTKFSLEDLTAFAKAFKNPLMRKGMKKLDFSCIDLSTINNEYWQQLHTLAENLSPKVLSLKNINFKDFTSNARLDLITLISQCQELEDLDLSHNDLSQFTEIDLELLANTLFEKKIKTLKINDIGLGSFNRPKIKAFVEFLEKLTHIENLSLGATNAFQISADYVNKITRILSKYKIKKLSLNGIDLTKMASHTLQDATDILVKEHLKRSLQVIDIRNTNGIKTRPDIIKYKNDTLIASLMRCRKLRIIHGVNDFTKEQLIRLYSSNKSPLILSPSIKQPKLNLENANILFNFYAMTIKLLAECRITAPELQRKILIELVGEDLPIVKFLLNNHIRVEERTKKIEESTKKDKITAEKFFPCKQNDNNNIKPLFFSANSKKRVITDSQASTTASKPLKHKTKLILS